MNQSSVYPTKLPLPEFIFLMASLTSLVALSLDAMLPVLDTIGDEVGSTSQQQNYLIISLFFFGMALGQLFFGPFADAFGRRTTMALGSTLFLLGTLCCYYAQSIEILLLGRVIQAFGVSGPRIASMAIIRDLYSGDAMARVMSFINVIFILVPMLAPLIGQTIAQEFGWRNIFSVFAAFSLLSCTWFFYRQSETLPLSKRNSLNITKIASSIFWMIKQPSVMVPASALGIIFGAFLAYLSSSQTIFQTIYLTGQWFPLLFACLALSIGSASFVNGLLVMKLGMIKISQFALIMTTLFGLILTVLALYFSGKPPFVVFFATMFFGFFFIGILFGNLTSLAMVPVGHMAGLGAAFTGSLTSLIGVPISMLINHFMSNTITPIALGFLIFNLLAYLLMKLNISRT